MQLLERQPSTFARSWACATACVLATAAAHAEDAAYRYNAPIEVQQPAPFVRLGLPPSAYGKAEQAELRDLRIVDAAGERVPFAVLAPRAKQFEVQEQSRDVALYALPPRPAGGKAWPSPLEVTVQGDRISVRPARAAPATDAARSPGWLVDLGDPQTRKPDEPAPRAIRLLWSGPAEFSVGVDVELSDDLRQWRPGGSGQLLALTSSSGPLLQDRVLLPARPTRFVRLVWSDAAAAPLLSAAKAILNRPSSVILDVPTEIVVSASPEVLRQDADAASVALAKRAMHFDLGGTLPVAQIDLQFDAAPGSGTRIAPVRLQSRSRVVEPWHEVAGHVFFRIERGGAVSTSPPLALHTTLRYLRIVPDERAAPLDAAQTRLIVQAQLASLVFATQGRAPYTLFAGSAKAPSGALPIATLVPALDEERPRFGRASLGAWRESEQVVRQIQSQQRLAALRPWLLWAVLLAGVVGLGFMVWQLARRPTRDRSHAGPQPR